MIKTLLLNWHHVVTCKNNPKLAVRNCRICASMSARTSYVRLDMSAQTLLSARHVRPNHFFSSALLNVGSLDVRGGGHGLFSELSASERECCNFLLWSTKKNFPALLLNVKKIHSNLFLCSVFVLPALCLGAVGLGRLTGSHFFDQEKP